MRQWQALAGTISVQWEATLTARLVPAETVGLRLPDKAVIEATPVGVPPGDLGIVIVSRRARSLIYAATTVFGIEVPVVPVV